MNAPHSDLTAQPQTATAQTATAQTTQNSPADAGFSLIEVMVALFIFAIISTGTAYTVLSVMQVDRDSRARHVAANLAAQEIDLARDTADLLTLVDVERPTQRVGGNSFHVVVTTAWVTATGTDDACGATGGTLLTKRINVEVRWDNQRPGSSPVRADTVITPNAHLNSPDRGTILVRVLGASGTGVSGVTITARPSAVANGATGTATALTDSQGCAFLSRLRPGNYDVTANAAGHLDSKNQASTPLVTVPLVAGFSAGASFSYDRSSTFELNYAPAVAPAAVPTPTPTATATPTAAPSPSTSLVYLPRDLDTSFVTADGGVAVSSLSGTGTNTTRTRTAVMFPFASGYEVIAGRFALATPAADAPSSPGAGTPAGTPAAAMPSCLSVDPAAWAPVTENGATLIGKRTRMATEPGQRVSGSIPMGLLTVTGLTAGAELRAVSAPAPAGTGDPGCARSTTYNFGAVPAGSTIALPYGSWTLRTGSSTVAGTAFTLGSRGRVTGTVVTLDPRVVGTP
jgi:prepilin-type N-terminal cleavage/methylation domain-containing protein